MTGREFHMLLHKAAFLALYVLCVCSQLQAWVIPGMQHRDGEEKECDCQCCPLEFKGEDPLKEATELSELFDRLAVFYDGENNGSKEDASSHAHTTRVSSLSTQGSTGMVKGEKGSASFLGISSRVRTREKGKLTKQKILKLIMSKSRRNFALFLCAGMTPVELGVAREASNKCHGNIPRNVVISLADLELGFQQLFSVMESFENPNSRNLASAMLYQIVLAYSDKRKKLKRMEEVEALIRADVPTFFQFQRDYGSGCKFELKNTEVDGELKIEVVAAAPSFSKSTDDEEVFLQMLEERVRGNGKHGKNEKFIPEKKEIQNTKRKMDLGKIDSTKVKKKNSKARMSNFFYDPPKFTYFYTERTSRGKKYIRVSRAEASFPIGFLPEACSSRDSTKWSRPYSRALGMGQTTYMKPVPDGEFPADVSEKYLPDQSGHIFANNLFGPGCAFNMFPQSVGSNAHPSSRWKQAEDEAAVWLRTLKNLKNQVKPEDVKNCRMKIFITFNYEDEEEKKHQEKADKAEVHVEDEDNIEEEEEHPNEKKRDVMKDRLEEKQHEEGTHHMNVNEDEKSDVQHKLTRPTGGLYEIYLDSCRPRTKFFKIGSEELPKEFGKRYKMAWRNKPTVLQ